MSIFVVLILMIFAHIIDDYYLQGILASMKQRSWWQENVPEEKYRFDYIVALIIHSVSWSIMITFPIIINSHLNPEWYVYLLIGCNTIIHAIIDDLKANKKKINLIQDQTIHLIQIIVTWAICSFI